MGLPLLRRPPCRGRIARGQLELVGELAAHGPAIVAFRLAMASAGRSAHYAQWRASGSRLCELRPATALYEGASPERFAHVTTRC